MKKQRTIEVNGEKIKIVSYPKTSLFNFIGYTVIINNKKYFCNKLHRQECEDHCYAKYIKEKGV